MRGPRRSLITLVIAAAAALLAPAAHAGPVMPIAAAPEQPDHADAIRYAASNRDAAPPGANDMSCKPTAAHPNPVVLVHGTDATAYSDWAGFAPILKATGFCVFAINYGTSPDGRTNGYGVIEDSAAQLKAMTLSILRATGAAAVDVVGYSQGAAVARYFVNRLGGATWSIDGWGSHHRPTAAPCTEWHPSCRQCPVQPGWWQANSGRVSPS
nr:lipase family protein [Rhodococcus sp. BS-15]